MPPKLYYPVKPWKITQAWGIERPEVYAQFGFSAHNGIDVALGKNAIVRAPFDCQVVRVGYQPNGGGLFLSVISNDTYTFNDGKEGRILLDALHLQSIKAWEGQKLSTGDILAIADNTGYSTGPHTHFQFRKVRWDGIRFTFLDDNDANDSFDPTPYWTGIHAEDIALLTLSNMYKTLQAALIALRKLT